MKNSVLIPAITAAIVSVATTAITLHFACDKDRPCPSRYAHMKHMKKGAPMYHLKRADTNNDGELTKEEIVNAAIARFETLDANDDGKVSKDELKKKFKRNWRDGKKDYDGDDKDSKDEPLDD